MQGFPYKKNKKDQSDKPKLFLVAIFRMPHTLSMFKSENARLLLNFRFLYKKIYKFHVNSV